MNSSHPDRRLIREYLLGRLDEQKEPESNLSEGILFSDELSEVVESIEDEIIEEYLDGALDSADRNAVDEYFLRPLERKNKLRFARLLRHHFETRGNALVTPPVDILPIIGPDVASAVGWRHYFRTYGQLAALILLCTGSLIYISRVHKNQTRLEGQLAQEREHFATIVKEVPPLQSSLVPLTLVADRSRGDVMQIPHIEIKPSTQRILVEIALQGHSLGPFDVHLEAKGKKGPIWSAHLLPLVSPSGDGRLVFDLPVQGIESNIYSFVVSSAPRGSARPKYYDFGVKLTG